MRYCVIGLGVFGCNLCRHLTGLGAEVLAVGESEATVNSIKDEVSRAVLVQYTDVETVKQLGFETMDAIFIALGSDFEASMTLAMLALTARASAKNKSLKIYARALSPTHRRLLEMMGVDRIVVPEESAARSLAHAVMVRGALNGYDLGDGHIIIEAEVPETFVGKSLQQLAPLFNEYKVLLVTVKRRGEGMAKAVAEVMFGREIPDSEIQHKTLGRPRPDWVFKAADILVLMGPEKGMRGFLTKK